MIKKLAGCIGEYKKHTILTPLLILGEVIMECLIPFIIALLVNEVKAGSDFAVIVKYGAILFVMACISLLFGALAGVVSAKASCGFAKNLRREMYYRVQDFSFENIDKFSPSSLVTRMTTDVSYVQMAFMMIIRMAVRSPFMFVFAIIISFIMGGKMALMFVVIVPVLAFGLVLIIKKAMPLFRRIFPEYDKLNESIEENIKGIRVVKSFVREDYEKAKFNTASENVRKNFTKAERIVAFSGPLIQSCLYFNMVVVFFFGSKLIITSRGLDLDIGQFSAIITYGALILFSLNMLSMVYVMITISAESAHRIAEVLSEAPSLKNPEKPVLSVAHGSVDFKNVSFKYSLGAERYALSDINLHINSGETIGIIGGTGSSKTTLVQLISRLYDATEGTVMVGGVDVKQYDLETLRSQVAVVLQKNLLFSGTVADNLRWGKKDATEEEMTHACKLSQAHDFILSLPSGYNSRIEQGGANLSGGQRQRLCIARALLKRPKVLILDDSTSAVDTHTDSLIRRAFSEYIPETTKIIIAQRIMSVQDADRIIVMDGGRIEAVGTHTELLQSCRIYQEVFLSQSKGGGEDE